MFSVHSELREAPLARSPVLHLGDIGDHDGCLWLGDRPLGPGDRLLSWGVLPTQLRLLRRAERLGLEVLNRAEAVRASADKVALAPALTASGLPAVPGDPVRTADGLRALIHTRPGPLRITGGFSHNEEVARGPVVATPEGAEAWEAFIQAHVDHSATFLVQAAEPDALHLHVVVARGTVLAVYGAEDVPDAAARSRARWGLAALDAHLPAPAAVLALRALEAFGLEAGSVELRLAADEAALEDHLGATTRSDSGSWTPVAGDATPIRGFGGWRILDVHATPALPPEELATLLGAADLERALSAPAWRAPEWGAALAWRAARPGLGLVGMTPCPRRNIGRVSAEVELQGARPVFLSGRKAGFSAEGHLELRPGRPAPAFGAVMTRTGAIIDDRTLALLAELGARGVPILNHAAAMAGVRDKNRQAATLHACGLAHPPSRVVASEADLDAALTSFGPPWVLKNPSSSQGRGVMFLPDAASTRAAVRLLLAKSPTSTLRIHPGDPAAALEVRDREAVRQAVLTLGDLQSGPDGPRLGRPLTLEDPTTGHQVCTDLPITAVSLAEGFLDVPAQPVLKAEPWYQEAAGVDVRVVVLRTQAAGHRILAAMERRAAAGPLGEVRSNLHLGGTARRAELTPDQAQLALSAAAAFGLDIAGVDLIATRHGWLVVEVNSSPGLDIEKVAGSVAHTWIEEALARC